MGVEEDLQFPVVVQEVLPGGERGVLAQLAGDPVVGSEELLKVRKFGAVAFVLPTPVLVSLGRRRGESRERQPDTKHG